MGRKKETIRAIAEYNGYTSNVIKNFIVATQVECQRIKAYSWGIKPVFSSIVTHQKFHKFLGYVKTVFIRNLLYLVKFIIDVPVSMQYGVIFAFVFYYCHKYKRIYFIVVFLINIQFIIMRSQLPLHLLRNFLFVNFCPQK